MILELIMHADLSDNELPVNHNVVFCHTDSLEVDLMFQKLEAGASENDYYYLTEIDFQDD